MSLHLEFEPHSWYMGFAIKQGTANPNTEYLAVTANSNTGYVDSLEAKTLADLHEQIKHYHLEQYNGYGERIAKRRHVLP